MSSCQRTAIAVPVLFDALPVLGRLSRADAVGGNVVAINGPTASPAQKRNRPSPGEGPRRLDSLRRVGMWGEGQDT